MFDRLYRWTMNAGNDPRAQWVLAATSFAESALLPLPVDAILIPMMLADRRKVWWLTLLVAVTSVLGGMVGYGIGYFLYDTLGQWLIRVYGLQAEFQSLQADYGEYGWLVVLAGAISPIPYKVVAIASGVLHMLFPAFVLFSAIGRGVRFVVMAGLFWWFGPHIKVFIERNANLVGWVMLAVLLAGFAALYWF